MHNKNPGLGDKFESLKPLVLPD